MSAKVKRAREAMRERCDSIAAGCQEKQMPRVVALYRYPVKSFTPESCTTLQILPEGRVAGDRVLVRTPGGGGYGPARRRDPGATARDRRLGYTRTR